MFTKTFTAAAVAAVMATSAMAQDKSDWPSDLTIGTASQGAPISFMATALRAIFSKLWASMPQAR